MSLSNSSATQLIEEFRIRAARFPGPIPWSVQLGSTAPKFTVVFGLAIHGNEIGSIPAALTVMDDLIEDASALNARYIFILGNPDAIEAGVRFIDRDLNRCFNLTDSKTIEGRRSLEIAEALKLADVFIDYHQTNQPCLQPFFTFAYQEASYCWAAHMKAANDFVTRDIRVAFSQEGTCCDEWVRNRGKPAVTLELGQAGLKPDAHHNTLSSMQRVTGFVENELDAGRLPQPGRPSTDLNFYQTKIKLAWPGDDAYLHAGFENFQAVRESQELGFKEPGAPLISPADGYIMFPKYPKRDAEGRPLQPQSGDIVHIIEPLTQHPRELWT